MAKKYFNVDIEVTEGYDLVSSLTKDEKQDVINTLESYDNKKKIVRYMVDQYYQSQEFRLAAENQARAVSQGYDTNEGIEHPIFIQRTLRNAKVQEELNKKYINVITDQIPVCAWMKSIKGIGPIISAYLYATFDITKVQYATEFLSYAGLNDNNNKWLGREKAKELVNEAKAYRKSIYDKIDEAIRAFINEYKGKIVETKVETFYKKAAKLIKDGGCIDLDGLVRDVFKISTDMTLFNYIALQNANVGYLYDFILYRTNPKRLDMLLYGFVAEKTTRKIKSIEKGTLTTWNCKNVKTAEPTVDDLEAYLAKPPYNTDLKTLMYNIGDCFIKNKNRGSLYGRIYDQRLAEETVNNDLLKYKDQAEEILRTKNFSSDTITKRCLEEGKLSPAHLGMRARRYAVKLFISHVFEAMYWCEYHTEPPKHYILGVGGHHDYIAPEVDYHKF